MSDHPEKFSREWYAERGELEAFDIFYAWIKEQMEIEIAYTTHYAKWGIYCGPPHLPYMKLTDVKEW